MNAETMLEMVLMLTVFAATARAEPVVVVEVEVVPGAGWRTGNEAPERSVPIVEVPGLGTGTLAMDRRHVRIKWSFEKGIGGPDSTVLVPELPEGVEVLLRWEIDGEEGLLLESVAGVPQRDPDARFEQRWPSPDPATLHTEPGGDETVEVTSARVVPAAQASRQEIDARLDGVLGRAEPKPLPLDGRPGETVYEEGFDDADGLPADWTLEGPATVTVRGGRLEVVSDKPDAVHPDHGHSVLWAPVELPAPGEAEGSGGYVVDWSFTPMSDAGLAIVFFDQRPNPRNADGLFDPAMPERSGDFKHYVAGALDGYHVSYFATVPFNPGRGNSNLRKNRGLVLMAVGPMAEARAGEPIAMRLVRDGPRIRLLADGVVVMDAVDDDPGRFGPVYRGGRLGFRQMQWAEAAYDDVVARTLQAADRDETAAETTTVRGSDRAAMTLPPPEPTTFTYRSPGGAELDIVHYAIPDPVKFPGPRPAWVTFHGGGWVGGTPVQFQAPAEAVADAGVVTLSCQYRLLDRQRFGAPGTPTPADLLADARAAWAAVHDRAEEFGIDPTRMAAGGGSAGGHLAASLATLGERLDPLPAALVLYNPAINFAEGGWVNGARLAERTGIDPAAYDPATGDLQRLPPTLILHGTADRAVSFESMKSFRDRAAAAGADVELVGYDGRPHGFFNVGRDPGDVADVHRRTADFLSRVLRP